MRVERIKGNGHQQLYGIVRKKTLEYLGGYIQTAELKDMESYICAPAAAATKESSARPSWQEGRSRNLRSLRHTTR